MKLSRRSVFELAAGAVALPALTRRVMAEPYPARPVRLIVTVPPGSSPDIIGRLIAQWLSDRLGQPFVVENRPGASANIGTELALHAPPDGYTLLLSMSSNAINASLYQHLSFNFLRDAAPVAKIASIPLVMNVNPSVAAQSVPEFIAYAKANPGKITMASSGVGTPLYVAGELFRMMAGIEMLNVPYQGEAPAASDLLAGQAQVMFGVMPMAIGYIKAGKVRALAVTSATRQDVLPDVPAMNEFLPGYEASGWYGVVAPAATPPDIIATLNQAIDAGLADRGLRQRFIDLGCTLGPGSPADFAAFIAAETDKWAKVVKFAGIKAD